MQAAASPALKSRMLFWTPCEMRHATPDTSSHGHGQVDIWTWNIVIPAASTTGRSWFSWRTARCSRARCSHATPAATPFGAAGKPPAFGAAPDKYFVKQASALFTFPFWRKFLDYVMPMWALDWAGHTVLPKEAMEFFRRVAMELDREEGVVTSVSDAEETSGRCGESEIENLAK